MQQKVHEDKKNLRSHYQSVQKKRQEELDNKKLKILREMNMRAEEEAKRKAEMNKIKMQQRQEQEEIRSKKANDREAQRE